MKKLFSCTVVLALAAIGFAQSEADADKAGNIFIAFKNPFADRVARHEGDILTIIISETTTGTMGATTNLSKTDTNSITNGLPILQGLISGLSTGATSTNAGTGTTTANGSLTAQMTVRIKKVLPNGTFVIEGMRMIRMNKDTQTYKLDGLIRPDDIQPDNTIASSKIADARITLDGKGGIADRQRRGILTRVIDWLF